MEKSLQEHLHGQPSTNDEIGIDPGSVALPTFHFWRVEKALADQGTRIHHIHNGTIIIRETSLFQKIEIEICGAFYYDPDSGFIKKVLALEQLSQYGSNLKPTTDKRLGHPINDLWGNAVSFVTGRIWVNEEFV